MFELYYPSQDETFDQTLVFDSEDELRDQIVGLVIGTYVDQAPQLNQLWRLTGD